MFLCSCTYTKDNRNIWKGCRDLKWRDGSSLHTTNTSVGFICTKSACHTFMKLFLNSMSSTSELFDHIIKDARKWHFKVAQLDMFPFWCTDHLKLWLWQTQSVTRVVSAKGDVVLGCSTLLYHDASLSLKRSERTVGWNLCVDLPVCNKTFSKNTAAESQYFGILKQAGKVKLLLQF